ncbi:MAG: hypothetical protein HY298_20725 [Verrucomicrobia bacterium]|nr:hypothetical protein [Verrucomicrobiota bacterium]
MNTNTIKKLIRAVFLAAMIFPTRPVLATSYGIGLSPNYSPPDRPMVLRELLLLVLEGTSPGDEIQVYDALNLQAITRFKIPDPGFFQANARARAQRLASEIVALKKFLMTERTRPSETAGLIDVPQFLDLAATQIRRPNEPLRIILIGSPFYSNAGEEGYNMQEAFPSDGTLVVDQHESVFGCALKKGTMNGVTVHYAYLRQCFVNDFHQERICRFWCLLCQQRSGVLATFAPDVALALRRARENIQEPCMTAELDLNDTKIEMRQVARRAIPVWFGPTNMIQKVLEQANVPVAAVEPKEKRNTRLTPTANAPAVTNTPPAAVAEHRFATNIPAPVTSFSAHSFPIKPKVDSLGIGIMWSDPVDCDLYVKASPSAQELFYNRTKTKEGRYFHDYRNSNAGVDYEYVELKGQVDLNDVRCYVNYFAGKTSPVRGLVVVFYEGKSFYGEFEIEAPKGNNGWESSHRDESKYWARIDPVRIVTNGNQVSPLNTHR